MPASYQPKKAENRFYSFSISEDQVHLVHLLEGNKNRKRSWMIREALECFLMVCDLYGEDWREKLHEHRRPAWVSEIINEIHNIEIVAVRDNGLETEDKKEIDVGEDIFHEE